MKFKLNYENWDSIFAVPKKLVDDKFEEVSGIFIKILLLIIRLKGDTTPDDIAARLHVNVSDVLEAVSFWEQRGYITADQGEILAVDKKAESKKKQNVLKEPSVNEISADEIYSKQKNDPVMAFLFSSAENVFGRPLTPTEARTLIYIYEYIGLPYDVILMVVHYCVQQNKQNCRYILKMCQSWYDMGIDTHEKADAYLKKLIQKNDKENMVKKCFGIYDRNFSAKEKKFIETWFDEYKYEINVIRLAYERTIDNIGKISFPYINKILSDWHAKGIQNVQQASKEAYQNEAGNKQNRASTSYDLDAFDELGYHIPDIK